MAIVNNSTVRGILAALTSASMLLTATAAISQELSESPTPKMQSVDLPTERELQSVLSHLDGFMIQLDRHISDVYRLTEDYREYVQSVKHLLASCEVNEDISAFEAAGFKGISSGEGEQCNGWVRNFDQVAWQQADQLTVVQEYQQLVQELGENVSRQQDRVLIAMRARRLNDIVEQGFVDVASSRQGFAPWMDK